MSDTSNGATPGEPRDETPADQNETTAQPETTDAPTIRTPEEPPAATGTVYTPGHEPQPYQGGQPAAQYTQPTEPLGAHHVPPAFGGPAASAQGGATTMTSTPESAPRKRRAGFGIAAGVLAAALIGGGAGAGIYALATTNDDGTSTTTTSAEAVVVNDTDSVNEITAVAAKASPSVVTISVASGQGAGTGSGIVLSEDGYVLTNTHVVTLDGATGEPNIQVKTNSGELFTAELVGTDPLTDLAVIKLQNASGLSPMEFADSSKLNVGDSAIAIGAPMGLSGTVTNGIVSALNRSIDVASSAAPELPDSSDQGEQGTEPETPFDFWNFDLPGEDGQPQEQQQGGGMISLPVIQTDAAINPGNSGGALVDSDGALIGVNVAILSAGGSQAEAGNIGVGFAVPSNVAKRIADELIADGAASHGLLGATVSSAAAAENSDTVGALIAEVSPEGAAEAVGLQAGDVVVGFNGVPITDQTDLTAQVRALPGGAKADLTYERDGTTDSVQVTLGSLAD